MEPVPRHKTPRPIRKSEFPSVEPEDDDMKLNGNVKVFQSGVIGTLFGALVGMIVAWITAMETRGVTYAQMKEYVIESQNKQEQLLISRDEMHAYVRDDSPWSREREYVMGRLAQHDQQLGKMQEKIDLASNYIEQQKIHGTKP